MGLGAPNGEGLGAGDTAVSTLGHLGGGVPEVRPRTQPLQLRTRGPEALGDCEPWRGGERVRSQVEGMRLRCSAQKGLEDTWPQQKEAS